MVELYAVTRAGRRCGGMPCKEPKNWPRKQSHSTKQIQVRTQLWSSKADTDSKITIRALEELKRAIALNPSDADGYEGLSNLLVLMGDFDGAIKAIDVFSEFQPSLSAGTFFNLGTAQLLSGRSEILCGRWKDRLNVIQASLSIMLFSLRRMPPLEEKQTRKGRQRSFDGNFHFFRATISALSFENRKIARSSRRA